MRPLFAHITVAHNILRIRYKTLLWGIECLCLMYYHTIEPIPPPSNVTRRSKPLTSVNRKNLLSSGRLDVWTPTMKHHDFPILISVIHSDSFLCLWYGEHENMATRAIWPSPRAKPLATCQWLPVHRLGWHYLGQGLDEEHRIGSGRSEAVQGFFPTGRIMVRCNLSRWQCKSNWQQPTLRRTKLKPFFWTMDYKNFKWDAAEMPW